jgi:glycosyltransferase involved in cell wall biosynthesis
VAAREALQNKLKRNERLRVLFLNDVGFQYGAGLAQLRQIQSFLLMGHDVSGLCWEKGAQSPEDIVPHEADGVWLGIKELQHLHVENGYTNRDIVEGVVKETELIKPDIIIVGNLHGARWPLEIFLGLHETDSLVIAYAHDCYLFTGRCAYPGDCRKYLTGCDDSCPTADEYPQLPRSEISEAWQLRRKIFCGDAGIPLAVNSRWTLNVAQQALKDLRYSNVVYLGIDERLFKQIDRRLARRLLEIPEDRFVIMWGAVNVGERRKGRDLIKGVRSAMGDEAFFLLFGMDTQDDPSLPSIGFINDFRKMPLLYSSADLFVVTSLEEAFGQTMLEASACETPVAAFDVSGVSEVARNGKNALLANEIHTDALLRCIQFFQNNPRERQAFGKAGRSMVEAEFTLRKQGDRWKRYLHDVVSVLPEKSTSDPCFFAVSASTSPHRRSPCFRIVTPSFNAEEFIDDTIASVVNQAGCFSLHYHIQDGGSTDGTLEKLQEWERRISSGNFPRLCTALAFTFESSPDKGMYDAINQGVARFALHHNDYMTWLNTDDRLLQGTLATVAHLFERFPDVKWLGGRPALMDERGVFKGLFDLNPYPRRSLRAGICDGRHWGFVMQEGTFWRGELWQKVHGLRKGLRLAGDFDLWRRFAEHEDYVVADFPFALHRRHSGQLSDNLDAYHAEVDAVVDKRLRDSEWERHVNAAMFPEKMERYGYSGRVLRFNVSKKEWELFEETYQCKALNASAIVTPNSVHIAKPAHFVTGVREKEPAYPQFNLLAGARWMVKPVAAFTIEADETAAHQIALRCRNLIQGLHGKFLQGNDVLAEVKIPYTGHERDCLVTVTAPLKEGPNTLSLVLIPERADAQPPDLWLLVISCEAVPLTDHSAAARWNNRGKRPQKPSRGEMVSKTLPDGRPWPKISIVTLSPDQGQGIEETLLSIIRQDYPNVELILMDCSSTEETRAVAERYQKHIAHRDVNRGEATGRALKKGFEAATGDILAWLSAGNRLASNALYQIALAFYTSEADMVAGVSQMFEGDSEIMRHISSCADGPLPLEVLRDVENAWLEGHFFRPYEVAFTRDIWKAIAGSVDESLRYAMEYEWVLRFAQLGALIYVIGAPLVQVQTGKSGDLHFSEHYRSEVLKVRDASKNGDDFPVALEGRPPKNNRRQIRILFFNDVGFRYGAGIAHQRLAEVCALAGHEVIPVAFAADDCVLDRGVSSEEIADVLASKDPDLVILGNLHHICADTTVAAKIAEKYPTLLVMHDQWILTGRCGYTGECHRYLTGCDDRCPTASEYPALNPEMIAPAFRAKRESLRSLKNLRLVGNSGWTAKTVRETLKMDSTIAARIAEENLVTEFRLGIDTSVFRPHDKEVCRAQLNLPQDKFIILTSASAVDDPRKGLRHLLEALEKASVENAYTVGIGAHHSSEPLQGVDFRGYIYASEELAQYYSAADLFVGPSLQEAFGQVFIEAAACGTPALGYPVGGIPEAIVNGVTGYVARQCDPSELAELIARLYRHREELNRLAKLAPIQVRNEFSYYSVYRSMVNAMARNGFLQKLGLSPVCEFAVSQPQLPPLEYIYNSDVIGVHGTVWRAVEGFDQWEGPYPDINITQPVRWALWPKAVFDYNSDVEAEGEMCITCRNIVGYQVVDIESNGRAGHTVDIANADMRIGQSFRFETRLKAGLNRFCLNFLKRKPGVDHRNIVLLIESIDFISK